MSIAAKIYHILLICLILIIKNADFQNTCSDVPNLHILPGMGWDALKNEDTKQLLKLSYEECKLTTDGKYLIPDNVVAVALPFEKKHVIGEIFDHWTNYTAPTASSFKTATDNVTILPLYYSFSDEYQEIKNLQVKHHAAVCRIQLKQLYYRINSKSDSSMTEFARERFMDAIRAMNMNDTEKVGKIVENIIKDFGTHYSSSVDMGTILLREDYVDENFYRANENRKGNIISSAKLSVLDYTGFSWRDRQYLDSSLFDDYNGAILVKKLRFYGGPNWEKEVTAENMVAVDRSGHLLSSLITPVNFPNITDTTLIEMKKAINKGIREYFDRNVHYGCIQPKSTNFDFSKNLDDGSCNPTKAYSDHVFGGVYEKCESMSSRYGHSSVCSGNIVNNPITQTVSCPTNFQPTILDERYSAYSNSHDRRVQLVSCMGNYSQGSSLMFGGLFSSVVVNIFTKSESCPPTFKALSVLEGNLNICINTTNNDNAKRYALPFGGFASCSTEFQCPVGYNRHLAVTYNNKNIYYCLQSPNLKNFGVKPVLKRPPYNITKCTCTSGGD